MNDKKQSIYVSSTNNRAKDYFKYYKQNPFKFCKHMGIKLKWYQVLLILITSKHKSKKTKTT